MSKLLGGILQAVGILIAGASGLCSLFFIVSMIPQSGDTGGALGLLMLIAMIGGIPFLIGFGLFRWGRSIVRQAERDAEDRYE